MDNQEASLITFSIVLHKAAKPNVVLSSPDAEKVAGLADVVRDLLSVLEHAKPSLDLASLLLLVRVGASSRISSFSNTVTDLEFT